MSSFIWLHVAWMFKLSGYEYVRVKRLAETLLITRHAPASSIRFFMPPSARQTKSVWHFIWVFRNNYVYPNVMFIEIATNGAGWFVFTTSLLSFCWTTVRFVNAYTVSVNKWTTCKRHLPRFIHTRHTWSWETHLYSIVMYKLCFPLSCQDSYWNWCWGKYSS